MQDTETLSALTIEKLNHSVATSNGELDILKGINLSIRDGESVAIVGASGSGKSTLLGLMAGLDQHTQGSIRLYDQPLEQLDEEGRAVLRGQYVGFIFQSFHLLPSLTALENVMLPNELKGDRSAKDRAQSLLEQVGLSHRISHYPRQLSGGEQQRVAIARAFASAPKILFADEPTGNLDSKNGALVEDLLFELNQKQGTTLVVVTHDPELAARCDRQIEIHDGELKES
ncbi:MAG: ABC transporter [Marinomonas sp.]|jgi:putative ABC transport system ATP-binding protein|uniref:Putative ABC transport system ATP-binding protein n=1 Tax=Marinomonas communis TaxID=28254 RepID=A0A4R6XC70_9GAMM|nr:ABC transporter ATP-binding protein [Marinomonas communis]MAF16900.1 ABC transporter [Marinomonas sp.]RUM48962.1 MAG: ABC transporter [Marinomonas sp.]RUM49464.1 MAG: ABC transporter [Marinomonas sp.]TDR15250.1 putative ABC transport system ATP-binding protein [Marinomonas communis]|tara:strand:+ start:644 stop:1330 length:687 start_codon:yes stop_codon:yes gene_type:complete